MKSSPSICAIPIPFCLYEKHREFQPIIISFADNTILCSDSPMNTGSDKISKVIVAVTGASGAVYGLELIRQLVALECMKEIAIIYSENGSKVWDYEKVM